MKTAWSQQTAFPMIADAIERLHRDPDTFVPRSEVVKLLLREPKSRKLIEAAYMKKSRPGTLEQYAGNMIDWLSHKWTVGDPKWQGLFDRLERSEKKIEKRWAYKPVARSAVVTFPDEVDENITTLPEGAAFRKLVNAYERNPLARQICIKKYGANCYVCGFSFGVTYGEAAEGLIHVHHILQLSDVGRGYKVDPVADLRPVCPNCHAVIHHRRNQAYTIEEVRSFLRR